MKHLLLALAAVAVSAETPAIYQSLPRLLWVVEDSARVAAAWEKAGVPSEAAGGVRTACFENIQTHWVQPRAGVGAFGRFLKSRGEGVMALAYVASSRDDLARERARLVALGVAVLEEGALNRADRPALTYVVFDTAAAGKVGLALIHDPAPATCGGRRGPPVTQYALTARQLDAVSDYWARLGFPAFAFTQPELTNRKYRGQSADFGMRLGWQRHLKIPFEWIEPLRGPNVYDDHIARHGEGFHHIAFNVADMDQAIARWNALGYGESMSGGWGTPDQPGSGRFAYHDLHAAGGIDIELLWNYRAPAGKPPAF
jgi:hypothetical protein